MKLRERACMSGMEDFDNKRITLAKWLLEFLGIPRNKGVNFHGKFGLGIPIHKNFGSKNLEIPRNSHKFPEIPRNSQKFPEIPRNS